MSWALWDRIHELPDQVKRQESSAKAACTPLEINGEFGIFEGRSGHYTTTLESCQCGDFIRRRQPCKHMYRLATELGVFGNKESLHSDRNAILSPRQFFKETLIEYIGLLENYTNENQITLKEILCTLTFGNQLLCYISDLNVDNDFIRDGFLVEILDYRFIALHYGKRNTMQRLKECSINFPPDCSKITQKYSWFMDHADDFGSYIFFNESSVSLHPAFKSYARDVYKYLHRKFDTEECYNPDTSKMVSVPAGVIDCVDINIFPTKSGPLLNRRFPDDVATEMLDLFGTNPLGDYHHELQK